MTGQPLNMESRIQIPEMKLETETESRIKQLHQKKIRKQSSHSNIWSFKIKSPVQKEFVFLWVYDICHCLLCLSHSLSCFYIVGYNLDYVCTLLFTYPSRNPWALASCRKDHGHSLYVNGAHLKSDEGLFWKSTFWEARMFSTSCNSHLGWHSTKFYTVRLLLEVQPLTLLYFSFHRRGITGWGWGGLCIRKGWGCS